MPGQEKLPSNHQWFPWTLEGYEDIAKTCRRYTEQVVTKKEKEKEEWERGRNASWMEQTEKGERKKSKSKKEQLLKMLS